jgi:hypothetical protein
VCIGGCAFPDDLASRGEICIQTVWGRGYVLLDPQQAAIAAECVSQWLMLSLRADRAVAGQAAQEDLRVYGRLDLVGSRLLPVHAFRPFPREKCLRRSGCLRSLNSPNVVETYTHFATRNPANSGLLYVAITKIQENGISLLVQRRF